jgi:ABC-type uncharacterized transport system substrate-binding protein
VANPVGATTVFSWWVRPEISFLWGEGSHRLPVLSSETGFAEAGGLMNCGDSIDHGWRRSAAQVDKILKGAKPGDLPQCWGARIR